MKWSAGHFNLKIFVGCYRAVDKDLCQKTCSPYSWVPKGSTATVLLPCTEEDPSLAYLYNIPEVWVCHVPPVEPLQLREVVEEVGGVVAQGAEGVGPVGGVREREFLQERKGEEGGHVLKGGGEGRGGRGVGVECAHTNTTSSSTMLQLRACIGSHYCRGVPTLACCYQSWLESY